jgi:hypothetical protein
MLNSQGSSGANRGNSVGTSPRCLNLLHLPHHDEEDTLDIQSGSLMLVRAKNMVSRNQMIFSAFGDIVTLPDPVCKLLTLRL